MSTQATERLIATVRDPASTDAAMNAAAQAFFNAVGRASLDEANHALSTIAGFFSLEEPKRAAFLALVCGALVERGCDPLAIAQPLRERLQSLLEAAATLADACRARMPKSEDEDQDPREAFEQVRQQLVSEMPAENPAWEALNRFWPPAIAVFSVSAPSRAAARGLRDLAARVADHHEAGHWLRLILSVLDDEPILVIEPQTSLGILARISGVVDNFQLNMLLMDGFPKTGFLARRRIPQRVADVAHGIGPQQTDDIVTSVWNLYTWKAIEPGLQLPNPNDYGASANWIWNEGSPEDIPIFEDRRVVLLGPASYPRSWRSQRMFDRLPAKVECERKLTKAEITDWLQRMLAAKSAS
jgi:hypothetical protein